jgi:hypothetical protein
MRELQAQSGNESDEVLEAVLADHCVAIIPTSDFKALVKYLHAKTDNAVRNALIRLGWESTRLSLDKKQQRVWVKKGLMIENSRIKSTDLAGRFEGAVANGFEWFPLDYYLEATWGDLRDTKLKFKPDSEPNTAADLYSDGAEGPYLDSETVNRYQTWLNDRDMLDNNKKTFMQT